MKIIGFLLARLTEGSTWAAVSAATGAFAVALNSHAGLAAAFMAAVAAVLTPDKSAKK